MTLNMREIAVAAGFTVHARSSHGPKQAYDWGPKSPMLASHFNSEEEAWRDVEKHVARQLVEARKLVAIVDSATTARPTERGAVEGRDRLIEHLEAEFGDSYDCTRVWSAWSVGTMGEDDFSPINDRVCEIADGILDALTPPVTVAATDQAGEDDATKEVAELRAVLEVVRRSYGWNYMGDGTRALILAALDTQPTTGRTKEQGA